MPRPLCSPCEVEMRPTNNNITVITHASFGPYTLTNADEYTCPKCGHRIVTGFAQSPYFEHWQTGFSEQVAALVLGEPQNIRHNREYTAELQAVSDPLPLLDGTI